MGDISDSYSANVIWTCALKFGGVYLGTSSENFNSFWVLLLLHRGLFHKRPKSPVTHTCISHLKAHNRVYYFKISPQVYKPTSISVSMCISSGGSQQGLPGCARVSVCLPLLAHNWWHVVGCPWLGHLLQPPNSLKKLDCS